MNDVLFVGEHTKTYDVRPHMHESWELVYCTDGCGVFEFKNGVTISYKTGEIVAIPPNVVHTNTSDEGFTNIHINLEDPSFTYKSMFKVSDDSENRVRAAFEQAKYFYMIDIKKKEIILSAIGGLIAAYIIMIRSNDSYSDEVEQVRATIMKNIGNPAFSMNDYLKEMPVRYDYIRKTFKKEVGVAPGEFLSEMRMKKAESIFNTMQPDEYTVADIAEMCGYADPLYFSRAFKQRFGVAPSYYLKDRDKIKAKKAEKKRTEV